MKKILILLLSFFMLAAFSASAATFRVGEVYEYKGGVIVDDLYIVGGAIDVTGDINGDGILVGGDISVLGNVTEDILAAGGVIRLLGSVGDDVRVVGGDITVSSKIGGDLVVAGGFVRILSDSIIAGEAVIVGGTIVMNGTVASNLTIYGEEVTINGPVNGDVTLRFSKKVTIGEDASIAGNLTYSALEEVEIPEGVLIGGEVTRVELPMKKFGKFGKEDFGKFVGFLILGKILLMLVTGVLAVLVFKQFSRTVGGQTYANFWKHALLGFVALIIIPIAAVLLLVTMLGAYIGFLLLGAYILMLAIAKVYAGIVAGALLSKWIMKKIIVDWKWALLGITALQVILLIPFFGNLVAFILILATFGTLGTMAYRRFWLTR